MIYLATAAWMLLASTAEGLCESLAAIMEATIMEVCSETSEVCEALFRTSGTTCNSKCESFGLVCVDGWDDNSNICSKRTNDGCDHAWGTQICSCLAPSVSPTDAPSLAPSTLPTESPSTSPSRSPTMSPTIIPTTNPTEFPTMSPTNSPTADPTVIPTELPTSSPSNYPTSFPSNVPTESPTELPTDLPTISPTLLPTEQPTDKSQVIAVFSTETLINAAVCILAFVSLTISMYACCKLKKLSELQRAWDHKINRGSYLPTDTHKRVSTFQLSEISIDKRMEGSHQVKISLGNPDAWTTLQGSRVQYTTQGETPQGD